MIDVTVGAGAVVVPHEASVGAPRLGGAGSPLLLPHGHCLEGRVSPCRWWLPWCQLVLTLQSGRPGPARSTQHHKGAGLVLSGKHGGFSPGLF